MADFKTSVAKTLVHEGGYVNNPDDKGGPTNFGITQADMPGVDMRAITPEQAMEYYREHYWKDLYSQIDSQDVADKLFDMGVLTGVGEAVKLLQRSLSITADGVFGHGTLTAVNQVGDSLLDDYRATLRAHYEAIVAAHPVDAEFIDGWENRVNS
jgi:lysozyme family protein